MAAPIRRFLYFPLSSLNQPDRPQCELQSIPTEQQESWDWGLFSLDSRPALPALTSALTVLFESCLQPGSFKPYLLLSWRHICCDDLIVSSSPFFFEFQNKKCSFLACFLVELVVALFGSLSFEPSFASLMRRLPCFALAPLSFLVVWWSCWTGARYVDDDDGCRLSSSFWVLTTRLSWMSTCNNHCAFSTW